MHPNFTYHFLDLDCKADAYLNRWLEQSVFQVLTPDNSLNGTGFFITPKGDALTCYHVLYKIDGTPIYNDNGILRIAYDGTTLHARFIRDQSNESEDYATLCITKGQTIFPSFDTLQLNRYYQGGDEVICFGFRTGNPIVNGNDYPGRIRPNRPTAKVQFEDNLIQEVILVDGDFGQGLSGSPVVSSKTGAVVGIQTGRHWEKVYDFETRTDFTERTSFLTPIWKVECRARVYTEPWFQMI